MNNIVEQQNKKPTLSMGGAVSAIVPQDINQAFRLAEAIHQGGMSPYGIETPQKIMIAMLAGMEVGLPPMAAVQSVAVINNRPCMWGDALIGVVRSSGQCEYVKEWIEGEGDQMVAWCETKRRGETEPVRKSFTVDDAKKAKLWSTADRITKRSKGGGTYEADNDSPWYKYPKRMLQMRARAWCLRDTYADILKGMQVREEVEDYQQHQGPDNARDITPAMPSVVERLRAAQEPQDAQEGFSHGFVHGETETLLTGQTQPEEDLFPDAAVSQTAEQDAGGDALAPTTSPASDPFEFNVEKLKFVFRRLYSAVGPDLDIFDATKGSLREDMAGENDLTRQKANTISTQLRLLCLGDVERGEMVEYLAGVVGIEPKELLEGVSAPA